MHPQAAPRRVENLAFVFQELLTVGERLRSNRQQVADAASFRAQIWAAVKQADEDARRHGYSSDDIELATFAVIAFLDATILNLRNPALPIGRGSRYRKSATVTTSPARSFSRICRS